MPDVPATPRSAPAGAHRHAAVLALAAVAAAIAVVLLTDGSEAPSAPAPSPARSLHSRPDLRPPAIEVEATSRSTTPGLMLIGPKKVYGAKKVAGEQQGPMVVDEEGRARWFKPMPRDLEAYDVRVQRYRGKPVITWWQGNAVRGSGKGVDLLARVETVWAGLETALEIETDEPYVVVQALDAAGDVLESSAPRRAA